MGNLSGIELDAAKTRAVLADADGVRRQPRGKTVLRKLLRTYCLNDSPGVFFLPIIPIVPMS